MPPQSIFNTCEQLSLHLSLSIPHYDRNYLVTIAPAATPYIPHVLAVAVLIITIALFLVAARVVKELTISIIM